MFPTPTQNQVNFDPYIEIRSSSILHIEIKSISITHARTMSGSMLTPKPGDFRPAYKNQVTFDHPLKKPSRSISA